MTLPAKVDAVEVYAGDTTTWPTYTFFASDGVTPEVLTGTWLATWRTTPSSTDSVALTVDSSQQAAGIINVSASAAQTATFTEQGVWDLQNTSAGGAVRTRIYGQVVTIKDVTRV